tara:strand:- start:131 stop:1357 length:1227 start_codon:yes stop_codon:yes gene_type:complete
MNNVLTFGCRLNFWESDKINQILKKNGKCNLTVFNTCSVTNEAVKNTISSIKKFHIRNPNVKIAVTGCAVETNLEYFENMKEVSFVIKNNSKLKENSWNKLSVKKTKKNFHRKDIASLIRTNPSNSDVRKFIKIQNGCDHSCTFCIIPKCRGKSISDSVKTINNNIKLGLNNDIKEIILTGVDLTSWGLDLSKNLFLGDLIKNIFLKNTSYFRLRLSSLDVAELDNSFFQVLKKDERLMPHFHFSLQSLNNMILKRMKRRHSVEQVIMLFEKIRTISPNATFGADIIAGFPTESVEMFLETKQLIEDLEISHLHVFPYSEKAGTPASKMPQIPVNERRKRGKELRKLGQNIYLKVLKKQIFKKQKVLIENDNGIGKTENNFNVKLKNRSKGDIVETIPSKIENNFLIS